MATNTQGANHLNTGGNHTPPLSTDSKTKKAVSYFILPGIIPELKNLLQLRFGYLAYLIAMIYQMVRILPKNHPYANVDNIGKYGIRQVIAAAANQIKLERKNIDQIVIFVAILAGLILMVIQFASFLFFLFMGSAWAGPGVPANSGSIFITQNPQTDVAFYMIREVFGLPTMFGNLTGAGGVGEAARTPLHIALQTLFQFYNIAILVVAVLVFVYYIIVVVGETATTGVPFGQRFSHIYAPLRLVIAIGLLIPLNYGFNGSQYIAFYAAKLGSSFATNGWLRYNEALNNNNPMGQEANLLLARANSPDITGLIEAMSVIRACTTAYAIQEQKVIQPYIVDTRTNAGIAAAQNNYDDFKRLALEAGEKAHFPLYFGELNPTEGNTPYCGEIKMPVSAQDQLTLNLSGAGSPYKIQELFYIVIFILWNHDVVIGIGEQIANGQSINRNVDCQYCEVSYVPRPELRRDMSFSMNTLLTGRISEIFAAAYAQANFQINDEILNTGWGGAGIWYNKIAQVNGVYTSAIVNIPVVSKRPQVMEDILEEKQKGSVKFGGCDSFEANLADNQSTRFIKGSKDEYYGRVFNETLKYWRCDTNSESFNFFWDAMTAIFGLNGLFNITADMPKGNEEKDLRQYINPLAKLSVVGKSLIESSIQNLGMAMTTSFSGGILGILSPQLGAGVKAASGMFVSIATIGLSIGFLLFYVLPFMPFIYFFFAVGGWVKGLFEAMVGAPLWALAHLRIDGDGIPGKSAMSGYLLIFEIFLRPILTVFGLIAGMAIFIAMAGILNEIFNLAVANVTGTNFTGFEKTDSGELNFSRSIVDKFFFTVVYAIILYMMATASFKMITLIPNNILRWLGNSVAAFNDKAQDPAASLGQYAALSGSQIGGKLADATNKLSQGLGDAVGEAAKLAK